MTASSVSLSLNRVGSLLGWVENAENSRDRSGRIGGVDRRQDQVPGFRSFDRDIDGFLVAHFPDEDDIRILTQCGAQGFGEIFRVGSAFALGDAAFVVPIEKLDRIFDRDDFAALRLVDQIDHGSQRCGFPAAGYSRHKHQSPFGQGNVAQDRGQSQPFNCGQYIRNMAQDQG